MDVKIVLNAYRAIEKYKEMMLKSKAYTDYEHEIVNVVLTHLKDEVEARGLDDV